MGLNLRDLLLVGMPEFGLTILTGIIICEGNIFINKKLKEKILIFMKIVFSVFSMLLIVRLFRKSTSNVIVLGKFIILGYCVNYRFVWKFNWRKSVICGILTDYILMSSEIITYPIINYLLNNILLNSTLFNNKFLLSLPVRLFQLLIIIVLLKIKISFKNNNLLNYKWIGLSKSKKVTTVIMILLILASSLFNENYIEMFVKFKLNDINTTNINVNLQIIYFETILFLIVVLTLLNRTIEYESFKKVMTNPKVTMEKLLENSTEQEIVYYSYLFKSYNNIVKLENVEQKMARFIDDGLDIEYKIDEKLIFIDFNYSTICTIMEYFLEELLKISYNNKLFVNFYSDNDKITIDLNIKAHEIQLKRVKKIMNNDDLLNRMKAKFEASDKTKFKITYENGIIRIKITMFVKEVKKDEKKT